MKSAVIVFPGSNCDRDLATAFASASGQAAEMVWHKETALPAGLDIIGIPGGFSYGDYLRCGAIAARSPIMAAVADFAAKGGHVIGICNGFQVLIETGLLPGALLRNAGIKFVCRNQALQGRPHHGQRLHRRLLQRPARRLPDRPSRWQFSCDAAGYGRAEGRGPDRLYL